MSSTRALAEQVKAEQAKAEEANCCGLAVALEAVGERWSFMILRAAFNGTCHFEAFLRELGIARNILSNRLTRLVEFGVLERSHCCGDRRRIEYRLTEKGRDLLPAMAALRQWGEKWQLRGLSDQVLCDRQQGMPIAPIRINAADGRPLVLDELTWRDREDLPGRSA